MKRRLAVILAAVALSVVMSVPAYLTSLLVALPTSCLRFFEW